MDKINAVGNNLATSNDEVVDALTRSSAAMAEAGNSLTDTISLEAASIEVVRNAETVGQAYKTIAMRLQGLDEETGEVSEDLTDLHGKLADLTKTAKTPGGISIYTNAETKELKSTKQLLTDIHDIYDDLNEKQQAEVRELIGGKRGGQVVGSLLRNWEAVEKATEVMENSAGSAEREVGIASDSIEFKLNALKETWVGILQSATDRGDIGTVIDFLTDVSNLLKGIVDTFGALPVAGGLGAGILSAVKGVGVWEKISGANKTDYTKEILAAKPDIKTGAGGKILASASDIELMQKYNVALRGSEEELKKFVAENETALNGLSRIGAQAGEAGFAWQEYTVKSKSAAVATKALSIGMNMLMGFGISLALTAIVSAIDAVANASKHAEERLDKLVDEFRDMKEATKSSGEWVEKNAEKFVELSKGVDALGRNIALTDDEYKEYLSLSNEAASHFPQMITYWDDMGNKIVKASNGLEDFNKQQDQKNENDRKAMAAAYSDLAEDFEDGEYTANGKTYKRKDAQEKLKKLQGTLLNGKRLTKYNGIDPDHVVGSGVNQKRAEDVGIGADEINEYIEQLSKEDREKVEKALDKLGEEFTLDQLKNVDVEAYNALRTAIDNDLARLRNDLYHSDEANAMAEAFQNTIFTDERYKGLSDEAKSAAEVVIGQFDAEMIEGIFKTDLGMDDADIKDWVSKNVINPLRDGLDPNDLPNLVEMLFTAKEEDFKSYSSYFEYIKKIIQNMLAKEIPADVINQWLQRAGLSEGFGKVGNDGSIQSTFDTVYSKFAHIEGAKEYINSLTKDQISELIKTDTNEASAMRTLDGLKAKVESLNPVVEETKQSFDEMWNSAEGENAEAKEELLGLAKAGKLTAKVFDENTFGKKLMEETGKTADQLTNKINSLIDDTQHLAQMKTGISAILEVYDEKRDSKKNRVGGDTLKSLGETLEIDNWKPEDLKVWEKYKKVAGQTKYGLKDLKKAQDDLATSYVNTNNFLQNLNKSNKGYYQDVLTEMGVTNSAAVVQNAYADKMIKLNKAKFDARIADFDFAEATDEARIALGDEMDKLYGTSEALGNYILQVGIASGKALQTDASIQNLIALATQCGATVEAIQAVATAQSLSQSINTKYNPKINNAKSNGSYQAANAMQNAKNQEKNKVQNDTRRQLEKLNKIQVKGNKGNKGDKGNNGSPSGGPSKSSQNDQKQYIDWIERRITRINNIIGNIQAKIENIGKWTFGKKMSLSNSKDNKNLKEINAQLDKEIKYYKTLYNVQKAARGKYQKKADSIAKKNKKVLTKSVINKIQSGKYNSNSFKKWYQGLSDKQKNVVDQYIEFYDKGKQANQGMKESVKAARDAKIQKAQNKQDLYDKRISRAEAKESYYVGADRKNKFVEIQLDNLKKSYAQQKEIAKLNGDYVEYERLTYEEKTKQRELLYHEIENIKDEYEILRDVNNRRIQDADNLLSVAEAEGRRVNTGWYTSKNINERKNYDYWSDERKKILEKLDGLKEGSTEWNNAMNDLQETENGMAESQKNIASNLTSIRDIIDGVYDEMRENNNAVYEQAQFLASLKRGENINTADRGENYYRYTETGLANMAAARTGIGVAQKNQKLDLEQLTEVQNLLKKVEGMSAEEADKYIKNLNDANYSSYDQLITAEKKYTKQWMTDRKAQMEAENSLIDLMKEYYEGQKSYLAEMIEARKKILQEEKDMYDYEKSINEKTKNISTLQKRLAAIQGDNSEAGKARRQQIQSQLDQAQQDLQDTQYDKWKSDQEAMLDNLSTQYNDIVDRHLKNPEVLLSEAKDFLSDNNNKIAAIEQGLKNDLPNEIRDGFDDVLDMDLSTIGNKLDDINSSLTTYLQEQKGARNKATSQPGGSQGDPKPSGSATENTISSGTIEGKASLSHDGFSIFTITKSDLKKMVKDAGGKKGKDSKDYSALNTLLYKATGYILPDHSVLKKFYKIANGTTKGFDDKFGKDGILYKILKESGFKTGGIGRLVKASGEDGFAMVRNGEGFVAPESVNAVQQWMNTAPDMTAMLNMINKNGGIGGTTTIGEMNFELPNVTDARSLIETFQNSKDMQRLLKIGVEDLMGQGKFSNKIFTV